MTGSMDSTVQVWKTSSLTPHHLLSGPSESIEVILFLLFINLLLLLLLLLLLSRVNHKIIAYIITFIFIAIIKNKFI